jgi:hypothetical protein
MDGARGFIVPVHAAEKMGRMDAGLDGLFVAKDDLPIGEPVVDLGSIPDAKDEHEAPKDSKTQGPFGFAHADKEHCDPENRGADQRDNLEQSEQDERPIVPSKPVQTSLPEVYWGKNQAEIHCQGKEKKREQDSARLR